MNQNVFFSRITFFSLTFIILYSTLQFILILRHKSPYISDSYFYKHSYHQFQGDSFSIAYQKVISRIDPTKATKVEWNIFYNESQYKSTLEFFTKRPFYPYIAHILNLLFNNELLAFTLPVFAAYLGLIIITYMLFVEGLNNFFATLGTFIFVSFYPFLDWSTYFLTDTIGAFFWMLQVEFFYKYLQKNNKKWLWLFITTFVVSLANREQSILLLPLIAISSLVFYKLKMKLQFLASLKIVFALVVVVTLYFVVSTFFGHKNLLDTIYYTMNNYGYLNNSYQLSGIIFYLTKQSILLHTVLIKDLASHHVWFLVLSLSSVGAVLAFKKLSLISAVFLMSAIASYSFAFIFPELSYRYYYPAIISICYFCVYFLSRLSNYDKNGGADIVN